MLKIPKKAGLCNMFMGRAYIRVLGNALEESINEVHCLKLLLCCKLLSNFFHVAGLNSLFYHLRYLETMITTGNATCTTDYSDEEDEPFTVCLLAIDKEDNEMHKLMKFNVTDGSEEFITEIPYRKDCALASLQGEYFKPLVCQTG